MQISVSFHSRGMNKVVRARRLAHRFNHRHPLISLSRKIKRNCDVFPLVLISKPSGANAEWLKMKLKYNKTENEPTPDPISQDVSRQRYR
jgi:hypothetical protein